MLSDSWLTQPSISTLSDGASISSRRYFVIRREIYTQYREMLSGRGLPSWYVSREDAQRLGSLWFKILR